MTGGCGQRHNVPGGGDRRLQSDKLHRGGFGEVDKLASRHDKMFGDGNAEAHPPVKTRSCLQGEESDEAADKRISDGQRQDAIGAVWHVGMGQIRDRAR